MSLQEHHEDRHSIVVDYQLSAAPATVWRALTVPELLASWLMPSNIKPEIGHDFTFKSAPAPGFDGIVHCKILDVMRPTLLVYSWRGGPIDTIVTWTLTTTTTGGTALRLEQSGFGSEHRMTYDILSEGWRGKASASLARITSSIAD
jgi:uncharacterized protein YndB with AHSA1/START domain